MKNAWMTIVTGAALGMAPTASAVVAPAPGYLVRTIATPETVQGDVAAAGDALLVGQGDFGPGQQRIVRLDAAGATTIASGFGGLGGFALDADGTLYVVDNCYTGDFGCDGATTGDTVYAIPDALGRTETLDAAAAELLPPGSIPFAFDVLVAPAGGGILVSDGVGPGAGRVVRVSGAGLGPFAGGFDFTAGLATDGTTVFVGNSDVSFVGSVRRVQADGTSVAGALVDGLSGAFGLAWDDLDERVLVTGGFTSDFASSTVVAVDAGGVVSEIATGFGFSAGIGWDAARRRALVLDFGVSEIAAICRDGDADGVCDVCTAPPLLDRSRLVVSDLDDGPGAQGLTLRTRLRVPDSPGIDPTLTPLRLLVRDAAGAVLLEARVPTAADTGAGSGWSSKRKGRVWTYRGPEITAGVTAAKIKAGKSKGGLRRVKVRVEAAGLAVAAEALPLAVTIAIDAQDQCGTAAPSRCRARRKGTQRRCS
jgi:hypothetical protein